MTNLLFAPFLLLAAFLAAIGTLFSLMKFIQVVRGKQGLLPYLFYTSTFINVLQIISQDRNMFLVTEFEYEPAYPTYYLVLARANTAFILFAAFLRIIGRITQYGSKLNAPTVLIVAFLFFFFTNVVTTAFLSAHPSFEHYYIYLALVGTASLLFTEGEEANSIRAARNSFLALLVISAGFLLVKPEVVMDNNYHGGIIPGFTYRYAGLAPHANHLGQIIILFMLCMWNMPFSRRWLNVFGWTIGYVSLVAAQSKTSWISFIICMSCMGYFKHGDYLKQRLFNLKNPMLSAAFILLTMATVSVVLGMVMFSDVTHKISYFLSTRAGADLTTMTGRVRIWEVAINEWRSNPLFGYGLTIWDDAHRAKIGLPWAYSAHNQFYQVLASAGVFGVAGLVTYVMTLLWFTLKTARSSQGLTLGIFVMLFLQSISEVPLAISGHFSYDAITHLLLLMVICGQLKPGSKTKKYNQSLMASQRLIFSRGFN